MGTLSLKVVNFNDYIEPMMSLFEDHVEELTTNKELMILSPNYEAYRAMEESGNLLTIIAFDETDTPVAYSVNVVSSNLHYSGVLMCQNDLLFVHKDYRGRLGLRLTRETEKLARMFGCDLMLWHAKPMTELDVMLGRLKYKTQDIIYSKVL